MLLFTVMYR